MNTDELATKNCCVSFVRPFASGLAFYGPEKSMIKYLLTVVVGLACVSCGLTRDRSGTWLTSESDHLIVSAKAFTDSRIAPDEWRRFVESGGDPLGKKNRYFYATLTDRASKKTIRIPMIPADQVIVSPSSSYAAILSSWIPTDGFVVIDRSGK